MTPIERAARILAVGRHHFCASDDISIEDYIEQHWSDHVGDVRAVLISLWQPSSAMLEAANDARSEAIWQAMLGALLREGVERT